MIILIKFADNKKLIWFFYCFKNIFNEFDFGRLNSTSRIIISPKLSNAKWKKKYHCFYFSIHYKMYNISGLNESYNFFFKFEKSCFLLSPNAFFFNNVLFSFKFRSQISYFPARTLILSLDLRTK